MELKDISYIIAVVENKTISQAAKNLYISQPALSQAIARIEKQLGTPLFRRSGRVLTPTSAGEMVVQEGRKLLQQNAYLMSGIARLKQGYKEKLRFGISPFYSKYYLPGIFRYYSQHMPDMRLEIVEKISVELERDVLSGDLDFCFVPAFPLNPELDYHTVASEEIFLGVPRSHPANAFASATSALPCMDLQFVRYEPFILQPPEQKIASMQERIFHHYGFTPNVAYETRNWDTILYLTCSGVGLSLLPEVFLETPFVRDPPNFYRLLGLDTTRPFAVAFRHGRVLPYAAEQLISVFSEDIAKLKAGFHLSNG